MPEASGDAVVAAFLCVAAMMATSALLAWGGACPAIVAAPPAAADTFSGEPDAGDGATSNLAAPYEPGPYPEALAPESPYECRAVPVTAMLDESFTDPLKAGGPR